ncbi:single-stranded DNA-binding protein [Streptomyces sp. PLAI1-29]|uniref:Single-stranded DNA-binding protein n=1 Tax=Streptomyces zingiberis TaxID=2053010 RepID=A0ABX1C1V5_9ACTN|nr:single-stranded DNA-binding protein [Streptomyces zingiberis]
MNETLLTVTGNAATRVDCWETEAGLTVARFRLATTARHWDRQRGAWADGPTSFFTVWARRTLAANVAASVTVGEPLVVRGRLRVRESEHEGRPRTSADIDALTVGHDLARGTSAFRRVVRAAPELTARRVEEHPEHRPGSRRGSRAEDRREDRREGGTESGPTEGAARREAPPRGAGPPGRPDLMDRPGEQEQQEQPERWTSATGPGAAGSPDPWAAPAAGADPGAAEYDRGAAGGVLAGRDGAP